MGTAMPGCARCGAKVDVVGGQVGRRDTCEACGAELRSCVNCRHYDENAAKGCKEPFAEVPEDKESANFCEFFQIGEGGLSGRARLDDVQRAAEALFKKS
jgi:hypothetical protein